MYAAVPFALLLGALVFGMVYTPQQSTYLVVMLAGLIFGGATGAVLRGILEKPGENDARTSLLLGGVAGFVVGLAYLIPQWAGASEALVPKAPAVQYASAVLVALSAGIGFDTVFSSLVKQAQKLPTSPPAEK